ncbi:N-(5'-phosphoribosyl)anthranilate isomerase [Roseivivax sp. GX 12232]|uniref:N-(5'-phosphoribosyl)anthranilate isomerase n=1 Tax=Roseivivax sp. GX 12232 TaxID=2900547 RepID=UPI001E3E2C8B|nr:N-(5'-phosphoribosyl)anthranilate isomerase [Roseivivax sp. GX 12232]MCE0506692.1 N-(5'-phosphoribosyl)anthranilate isomerase [Roseivivax sp. GX 12232]
MDMPRINAHPTRDQWLAQLFGAKAVAKGGVVRRSVRDVQRMIGREAFLREVRMRGFHLVECGGQFIVICNSGKVKLHV